MKKYTLASLLLVFALVLAACAPEELEPLLQPGGGPTSTPGATGVEQQTPTAAVQTESTPVIPSTGEQTSTPAAPAVGQQTATQAAPAAGEQTATPQAQTSPTPMAVQLQDEPFLAGSLLNAEVRDGRDQTLGSIRDFVADLNASELRYAVIALTGGQASAEAREVLVPYQAIRFSEQHAAPFVFYLEADRQDLENAPVVDLNSVFLGRADWDQQYRSYWSDYMGTQTPGTQSPSQPQTPAATAAATPAAGAAQTPAAPAAATPAAPTPAAQTPAPATPAAATPAAATPAAGQATAAPGGQTTTPQAGTGSETYVLVTALLNASITDLGEGAYYDLPGLPGRATPPPASVPAPGAAVTPTPGSTQAPEDQGGLRSTPAPPRGEQPGVPGEGQETPAPGQQQQTPAAPGTQQPGGQTGRSLGMVYDLLIAPETGQIHYLLVQVNGQQVVPVPLQALTVRSDMEQPAARSAASLMITSVHLGSAPGFELGRIPSPDETGWDTDVRSYWDNQ